MKDPNSLQVIIYTVSICSICFAVLMFWLIRQWQLKPHVSRKAVYYLMLCLALFVAISANNIFETAGLCLEHSLTCLALEACLFLIAPCLAMFALQAYPEAANRAKLSLKSTLHLIPALIFFTVEAALLFGSGALGESPTETNTAVEPIVFVAVTAQMVFYRYWTLSALRSVYGNTLESKSLARLVSKVLLSVAGLFLILCLLSTDEARSLGSSLILLLMQVTYLTWIAARASNDTKINTANQEETKKKESDISPDTKAELEAIFTCIKSIVEKGVYSQKKFSLRDLSDLSGFRPQLCSQAINEIAGEKFYDWINGYRIELAKRYLLERRYSMEQVCDMVGFGAKSTFYTAFKKNEGMTPKQFAKNQRLNVANKNNKPNHSQADA